MQNSQKLNSTIHGTALSIYGYGVLLQGDSMTGKSELALELITRGHQLIADDMVGLNVDSTQIIMSNTSTPPFLHLRGIGFMDIASLYGMQSISVHCTLQLIIQLSSRNLAQIEPLEQLRSTTTIHGIDMLQFELHIGNNRPLAILVETIVKYLQQLHAGYDSHSAFITQQGKICN